MCRLRLRREEHRRIGNVLRRERGQPSVDRLRLVLVTVESHLGELGLHQPRIDAADPDIGAEQVEGDPLVQCFHRELGGVVYGPFLVDLVADSVSLLLPADRTAVAEAISSLTVSKLLAGFRGSPAGDTQAAIDAILGIAEFAMDHWDRLVELDVNPLMVLPDGQGVVAADALICISQQ